jgi:hypothetical protein
MGRSGAGAAAAGGLWVLAATQKSRLGTTLAATERETGSRLTNNGFPGVDTSGTTAALVLAQGEAGCLFLKAKYNLNK